MFLELEGFEDRLIGCEMSELVVRGDPVEVGEGEEFLVLGGFIHEHVVEGGFPGEETRGEAVGEVGDYALDRVAGERDGLVEGGERVEGRGEVAVVDRGGRTEEHVDQRETGIGGGIRVFDDVVIMVMVILTYHVLSHLEDSEDLAFIASLIIIIV